MSAPDEKLPQQLRRTTIYESPCVNLYRDQVVMPDGHVIEQYHLLDFGRGAVCAVVENGRGDILMERVARYPTGAVSWELPAGGIEEGESVLEAAQREVLEETGYTTKSVRHLYTFHPMNGVSNMKVHIMTCKVEEKVGQVDQSEIQGVRWFSPEELQQAIVHKEITDGFALVGLLIYLNYP